MIQFTVKSTGQSIRMGWLLDKDKKAYEINQVTIDGNWIDLVDTVIDSDGKYQLKPKNNEQKKPYNPTT